MKSKSIIYIFFTFCLLLLTSCSQPKATQNPIFTIQPTPTNSPIPAITAPTFSLTLIPPSTQVTQTPEVDNPILISYEHDGNDSIDMFTACLSGLDTLSFVLYKNGYLILFDQSLFMETTISQSEIKNLLGKIESTGFFSVKGNGDEFTSPPPTPWFIGNSMEIIQVQEKSFTVTADEYIYLVESIRRTIDIVKEYKPSDLKPYIPINLRIWVYPVKDTSLENFDPTPEPPILSWSYTSIPLDRFMGESKTISKGQLQFLMQQVRTVPVHRLIEQNGRYYEIMACPTF